MNPKNKRTLFLTSTICIILSIVAFALSHMGGASNENYILLYVIVNCTPFVRQYGILFRKWGVFVCQRDNESTTELKR